MRPWLRNTNYAGSGAAEQAVVSATPSRPLTTSLPLKNGEALPGSFPLVAIKSATLPHSGTVDRLRVHLLVVSAEHVVISAAAYARGLNHQPLRVALLRRRFGRNAIEHADPAPADETVLDRLVRLVLQIASDRNSPSRRTKTSRLEHAGHHARHAVRQRKFGLMGRICVPDSGIERLVAGPPSNPIEPKQGN